MSDIVVLPGGVEKIWVPVLSGVPDPAPAVQVSFDEGSTWHPAVFEGTEVALLVAHPAAVAPNPAAVVVPVDVHPIWVRYADDPESLIRESPYLIHVRSS